MSAQVRDMTKGSPAKLILLFAVPLMLGNIFQQLLARLPVYRHLQRLAQLSGSCG